MIRRKWVIYDRKSRRVMSVVYSFRKEALYDLNRLNEYYGRRKYAMQLRRFDTEKKCFISYHPNVKLEELPTQEGHEVAYIDRFAVPNLTNKKKENDYDGKHE